ncbi:unnamed protein product [Closterium sp. NIES-54]
MDIACTSMIHARAPHFQWPYVVQYAAHHLNLWPCVSQLGVSPTSLWTGSPGIALHIRVWGCLARVRDTSVNKISPRAIPSVFLHSVQPCQSSSQSPRQPSALPPQAAADPEGAGVRSTDPGGAASGGVGVGAESVPTRGSGAGGAGVGAEPVSAGGSSLRGAGIRQAVTGGATIGGAGAPSAGPGEPGTGHIAAGGAGSRGGATGALESGPGATTAPDTTPPPHPYPTQHQALLCHEEQLELERERLTLERQQLELQQLEEQHPS